MKQDDLEKSDVELEVGARYYRRIALQYWVGIQENGLDEQTQRHYTKVIKTYCVWSKGGFWNGLT
jgi:hypothetical protein